MKKRLLSKTEKQLWDQVRQTVRPLDRARVEKANPISQEDFIAEDPSKTVQKKAHSKILKPVQAVPGKPVRNSLLKPGLSGSTPNAALTGFSHKEKRRFSRGTVEPDARIDLHGMRQTTAFHALLQFLRSAHQSGNRTVLVITGKGGSEPGERGVLRRAVPHWLANDEFRALVAGIEPAARRHGGDGALYVRLRRKR